jgi:hypothetical protein
MQGEGRNIPTYLAQRKEKNGGNSEKGKEKNNSEAKLIVG